jgi:hypothetical protein
VDVFEIEKYARAFVNNADLGSGSPEYALTKDDIRHIKELTRAVGGIIAGMLSESDPTDLKYAELSQANDYLHTIQRGWDLVLMDRIAR